MSVGTASLNSRWIGIDGYLPEMGIDCLFFGAEKVLYVVFVNDLFLEGKPSGARRFDHAYNFGIGRTIASFKGCY